jgi:hypothetical protein
MSNELSKMENIKLKKEHFFYLTSPFIRFASFYIKVFKLKFFCFFLFHKIEHMAYLEDVDKCGQLSDSSSLSEDEECLDLKRQLAKADAEKRKLKKMLRKSELKRKLLEGQREIEDLKGK